MLGLKQVKIKYKYRGFVITNYNGDNEFEHLCDVFASAHLRICAKNDHIRDIVRSIRTIKERVRCGCHSIPYKKFAKLMTRSLVQDMITCLNMFPYQNWISSDLSPEAIIIGSPYIYYNKLRITFGAYAQVYLVITNSSKQRTVGVITLRAWSIPRCPL